MTAGGLYVLVEMSFGFIGTVLNVIVLATIKNSNHLLSEPAYLLIGVFDICGLFSDIDIFLIFYISVVLNFLDVLVSLDLTLLCSWGV